MSAPGSGPSFVEESCSHDIHSRRGPAGRRVAGGQPGRSNRPPSSLVDDAQAVEQTIYARGTAALDRGEFDAAATAFAEAAALKGERADGALYWSAYAHNKRGRRDDALQAIASLKSGYPKSRWLRDARALEVEIRQASGQTAVPERNGDDDLKLMALGGLMNADPDRALPLVEQMLASSQSDKVRDRALFVLAQSGSPKAREVLVRIARTGPDEDTQKRAIRYLGLFGGPESRQALVDIYKSSQNVGARKAVLHGFMVAGDRARLLEVARTETSPELKREAIHMIGVSGGRDELWQLYQQETSVEAKDAIINALFVGGGADRLAELAQKETDPRLRREAIQKLGLTGASKSAADAQADVRHREGPRHQAHDPQRLLHPGQRRDAGRDRARRAGPRRSSGRPCRSCR